MSNNITAYNRKIAELVLDSVHKYIETESKLQRGGGAFRQERPMAIRAIVEPGMGTPSSSVSGGKIKIPKVLKSIGHEAVHIVVPIAKKAATKVVSKLADKAVDAIITSLTASGESGAGMKRRGRPPKQAQDGGKFNFVKSLKSVGKTIEHVAAPIAKTVVKGVVNVGTNKAIGSIVDRGIALATNPAVDAGLEEGAEVAMMAAGIKRKRKPSRRNLIIGKLMKGGMCMAQANAHIKKHGLK